MLSNVRGVICPMVTPFDSAGNIDHAAARKIVDFLLAHGVQVLFPAGSTGEGPLLSIEERKALLETVLDQTAGRAPVIVHTGCMNTADTILLTRHARDAGATAASIITPFFFTYTEESIFEHYRAVAQAVPDFPLFVYVFPGNAKNDVPPALLARLRAAAPNIVGVKSSNPELIRLQDYIRMGGEGFIPLCGVDGLMLAALSIGSHGQVSGNSNVIPEMFRNLYDTFHQGDLDDARRQQQRIDQMRAVLKDGFPLAYFKAGLTLRGIPAGHVRAPMRELSPAELAQLRQELTAAGVLA